MPRLVEINEIVWGVAKVVLMLFYTMTVFCALCATLYLSATLGTPVFWLNVYALVGVMVIFKWSMFPRGGVMTWS